MAPSLRKACRSCTKCKRRCSVELPKCQRCRERRLRCIYDLEPLMMSKDSCCKTRQPLPKFEKGNDATARDFFTYISSLHMSDKVQAFGRSQSLGPANRCLLSTLTSIPITTDPEATSYVVRELLRVPDLVWEGSPTPFIHPRLHPTSSCKYFDALAWNPDIYSDLLFETFDLDAQAVSLVELLAATQALILFLIKHAFTGKIARSVRLAFELSAKWRTILLASAPSRLPPSLNPWESWILAESVRRTILTWDLVNGAYTAWNYGWCNHKIAVEALPFNPHAGLWLAGTTEEWSASINEAPKISNSTGKQLVSINEFMSKFAKEPFEPGEDLFQRLLLVSHHGKRAVEYGLMHCESH